MAEWGLGHDYATRTANLRNSFLKTEGSGATVFDDGAPGRADRLGGAGTGSSPTSTRGVRDKITDLGAAEFAADPRLHQRRRSARRGGGDGRD